MVYLSLGTNLGNRIDNINTACRLIEQRVGTIVHRSSVYETEPVGFDSDNKFLNICLAVRTTLQPFELLDETQAIERQMGRQHKSINGQYQDRIIDIDILLYDDLRISSERLIIPHPKMYERDFVMLPLKEISD